MVSPVTKEKFEKSFITLPMLTSWFLVKATMETWYCPMVTAGRYPRIVTLFLVHVARINTEIENISLDFR